MKFIAALVFAAAGIHRASAVIGAPFCMAACTPLAVVNPIAYAACMAGCGALAQEDDAETRGTPRFLPDGTVVFEKNHPTCVDACSHLANEPLTHAACLGGCAAGIDSGNNGKK